LDLANLASVRAFAGKVDRETKLDLLVNNAGVMAVPERRETADGFELQFGTNYLGPFALTLLLLPVFERAKAPRVTTVSSGAANMGSRKIHFDDPQWKKSYGPWKAYCQSKLANLIFMLELMRRSQAAGITLVSNAAHPGYARTNLQTSGPGKPLNSFQRAFERFTSQDAAAGALPTLRAATANNSTGNYFAPDGIFALKGAPVPIAVPKAAQDSAVGRQLWELSEELTGVSWPVRPQRVAFLKGRP
jgi:NAD(P)-dependent dehydrogenase (short-subunit alcohol dehydrogenase family)